MKKKQKWFSMLIIPCAVLLAASVVLMSAHAKDWVAYATPSHGHTLDDVAQKAVSDLHVHVDKQVLNSLTSTSVDHNSDIVRQRRLRDTIEHDLSPKTIAEIFENALLTWRLHFSMTLARII